MIRSRIVRLQPIHTSALLLALTLICTASRADQASSSLPDWTPSHILWEIEQTRYEQNLVQSLHSDLYSLKQITITLLLYKALKNLAPKQYAASMAAASGRVVDFYFDARSSENTQDLIIKTGLSNLDAVPGMTMPWMIRRGLSTAYSFRDSLYQLLPKPEFLFPAQPSLVYFKNPALNQLAHITWVQASNARQHGGTLNDNGFFLIKLIASQNACIMTASNRIEQALLNTTCQISPWQDVEIHLYPVHQQQENQLYIRFIVADQASVFYQSPYDYGDSQTAFITDPPVTAEVNTGLNGNTSASFFDIHSPENIAVTNTVYEERINPLQESTWVVIEDALMHFLAYPVVNNPELNSKDEAIVPSAGDHTMAMPQSPYLKQEGLTVMMSGNNSLIVIDEEAMDLPPVFCLVTDTSYSDIDMNQLNAIRQQRPDRSHLFRKLSMQMLHQLAFEYLTRRYVTPVLDRLFESVLSTDVRKLFEGPFTKPDSQPRGRQHTHSNGQNSQSGSDNRKNSDQEQQDQPASDPPPPAQNDPGQSGQGHGDDNGEGDTSDEKRRSSSPESSSESDEMEEMSESVLRELRNELLGFYWAGNQSPYLLALLKRAGVHDPASIPKPINREESSSQKITSSAEIKLESMDMSEASFRPQLRSGVTEEIVIIKPITTTVTEPPLSTLEPVTEMETTDAATAATTIKTRSKTGTVLKPRERYSPEPIARKRKRPRQTESTTEEEIQQEKGAATRSHSKDTYDKKPATKKPKGKSPSGRVKPQYICPVMGCTDDLTKHPVYKNVGDWWQHVVDKHIYKAYLEGRESSQVTVGYRISGQQGDFFCPFPGCSELPENERALVRHIRATPKHLEKIDRLPFNRYWKDQLFQVTDELGITTVTPQGIRTPGVFIKGQAYQCSKGSCGSEPVSFIYYGDQPFLIDLMHHKNRLHGKETRKLRIHAGDLLSVNPDTIAKRLPTRNGQGWHCHDCEDTLELAGATIGQSPEGLAKHYEKEHFGRVKNSAGEITVRCPFRGCNTEDDGTRAVFHDLSKVYPHLLSHTSGAAKPPRSKVKGWLIQSDIFPFVINPRRPIPTEAEDAVE